MADETGSVVYHKGYAIKIIQDSDPMDPRDNDNLGTMVCYSRRHNVGDKHEYATPEAFKEWLDENKDKIVLLPLYMLDHSGITMSTSSETFRACDPQAWDWGCVGVIYVTKEKIRQEYSLKRNVRRQRIEKVKEILRAEVEEYDQYLRGDVYGYQIVNPDGDDGHSCWGFFGSDHTKSGLLESAQSEIDAEVRNIQLNEGVQQELELAVA
jgi:hypothetical protein